MARQWREVEGDEFGGFYKFEKLGDAIEGTFVRQRVSNSGQFGPQHVYDIRQDNGVIITVTGNFDIDSKMAKVKPGSAVRIEYVNNKESGVNRDGTPKNPMKVFRVQTEAAGATPF